MSVGHRKRQATNIHDSNSKRIRLKKDCLYVIGIVSPSVWIGKNVNFNFLCSEMTDKVCRSEMANLCLAKENTGLMFLKIFQF